MEALINQFKAIAEMLNNFRATTRIGIVDSYDPSTYSAKVRIQPEDEDNPENSLTGWLPVFSPWIGNGWGMFCPPTPGDQVEVQFQEGSFENGIVCLRAYSNVYQPLAVDSGEFWLVHESGTVIKLTNDGNIEITSDQDLNITSNADLVIDAEGDLNLTVKGDVTASIIGTLTASASQFNLTGNVTINGDLNVTGNITDLNGANGSLQNIRTVYNSHIHTDPQGGDTGAADPQIT
jgi:phage baseplate assembly protein V